MITEDYVSFETANLLKDKRFDERCVCYYDTESLNKFGYPVFDSIDMPLSNSDLEQSDHDYVCYSAPTLQMAMKWLREVHNRFIEICTDKAYNFKDIIFRPAIYDKELDCLWESDNFPTYEKACEAAIKYCLENLI